MASGTIKTSGPFECIIGTDMNTIYNEGRPVFFTAFVCSGTGNTPTTQNAWIGMQYRSANGNFGVQVAMSFGNDAIYIRRRAGSATFTAWKAIT